MLSWEEIERVELPSPRKFQRDYVSRSRPAVFVGAMEHWPALGKWNPDYFKSRYGSLRLLVQQHEALTGAASGPIDERYAEQRFGDYLDALMAAGRGVGYLGQYPLFDLVPELREDVDFPPFCPPLSRQRIQLWIGPRSTNSKFHYDQDENLFAQVYGRKRVLLAPPESTRFCYPIHVCWGDGYSPIRPEEPDLTRYPLFRNVRCLSTELGPGDMLYIPLRWWHDVTSLEPSISVNLWWWPPRLMVRNLLCRERERLGRMLRGERGVTYGPRPAGRRQARRNDSS